MGTFTGAGIAFIGVVISRLRLDSPFTFTTASVAFAVTDDSPDIDVFDIDSDTQPGAPGFSDPTGTANDLEGCTEENGTPCDNLAEADSLVMDEAVSFNCEVDPTDFTRCIDVDVSIGLTNDDGQTLSDMGFTITSEEEVSAAAITIGVRELERAGAATAG